MQAIPKPTGPPDAKATVLTSVSRLDRKYETLAETLKDNGYSTGHFGKWHLGAEPYSPLQHGFDVDVPHHPGPGPAGSYVAPWKFKDFDHDPDIPDEHIEDRMAKEAVAFMERHHDKPFFLNFWMFSVHAPFDAKRGLIDKYRKQVDKTNPQRSPTYAAMIESMDDAVGTLLDTLDRLNISDNTIIIFASDNGVNMYNQVDGTSPTSNAPLRGGKATMWDGGVRGPAIVVYPEHIEDGTRSKEMIQSCDFYQPCCNLRASSAGNHSMGSASSPLFMAGRCGESIFTYFTPNPRAGLATTCGERSLRRLETDPLLPGESPGKHSYKLFNLESDIGEQINLAADKPTQVQELDMLISEFLKETSRRSVTESTIRSCDIRPKDDREG